MGQAVTGEEVPPIKTFNHSLLALTMLLSLNTLSNTACLASDAIATKDISWDQRQSVTVTRQAPNAYQAKVFMKSECLSAIIKNLHEVVDWSRVKKASTREKIWALFIVEKTAAIKINGFMLGEIHQKGSKVSATCFYDSVTPQIDISEGAILNATGLLKYFNPQANRQR